MMRYALWDALTRDPIDTDVMFERTSWNESLSTSDVMAGTLVNASRELLDSLMPKGVMLTASVGKELVFSGWVRRVTRSSASTNVGIEVESWRGYPGQVIHGGDMAWTRTDPAVIISELWCHILSFDGAPDGVSYLNTRTKQVIGTIEVGTEGQPGYKAADPFRVAWYLGTNVGDAISSLAASAAIEHSEDHVWDHEDRPFTWVVATSNVSPRRPDVVFVEGENIVDSYTMDLTAEQVTTSVLSLGKGQGPTRLAGNAWHEQKHVLRSVYADTQAPNVPQEMLDRRARRLLARMADPLPVQSLTVLDAHPNAPQHAWGVGDIVPVWLADRPWTVRITGIDHGAEPDSTSVIHLSRAEG